VKRGTCDSCGAEIIWAITQHGKRMPMDATPVTIPRGLYTLEELPTNGQVHCHAVLPVYQSHFASCPDADKHRR
jgi:hypothetical protein